MPRKTEATPQILFIGKWIVEKRAEKLKVWEDGGQRQFTLREQKGFRWSLNGKSSDGSRVRKTFAANDLHGAMDFSVRLLFSEIIMPQGSPKVHHDIAMAFNESIEQSMGQDEHKDNLTRYAEYFLGWSDEQGLVLWEEIRPSHISRYIQHLRGRGLKHKTILNYIEPVRFTARRMAADYPDHYRNPMEGFRVTSNFSRDGVYTDDNAKKHLRIGDILTFFDWLEGHPKERVLRVGALLGGLMGLRVREWVFLSWTNVDLKEGTITVQREEFRILGKKHVRLPKTDYSQRRLPMPYFVWDFMKTLDHGTLRVVGNSLPEMQKGDEFFQYVKRHSATLDKWLERALRKWNPEKAIPPSDLRNTLQTYALENPNKWNVFLVDRYCGHAPTTLMQRHYFGAGNRKLVDLYRQQVIPPLEAEIKSALAEKEGAKMAKDVNEGGERPLPETCKVIDIARFG